MNCFTKLPVVDLELNYAEVNVKQLAFCLKISFQSKTGLCLQIAEVSTTGRYFNIT